MNATAVTLVADATDTKERLLDAAERLFGERGFRATSIRDIAAAARANLGAVNYHFGTKEELTRAVLARRLGPLNGERLRLLDRAESRARGRAVRLEAILDAFITPTIRLFRENRPFMTMLARFHVEPDAEFRRFYIAQFDELIRRFTAALRRALPGVAVSEIFWRMGFVVAAMEQTWMCGDDMEVASGGLCRLDDDRGLVARLIDFGAAGLRAAVRSARTRVRPAKARATRKRRGRA